MSKHTPGPWHRDTSSGMKCDVRAEGGRKVALCFGLSTPRKVPSKEAFERYRAECDANANLIAAAPDLLEALIELVGLFDGGKSWSPEDHPVVVARAAISKAEGRS